MMANDNKRKLKAMNLVPPLEEQKPTEVWALEVYGYQSGGAGWDWHLFHSWFEMPDEDEILRWIPPESGVNVPIRVTKIVSQVIVAYHIDFG